ncbi:hypothetical protein GCM10022226_78430 [Sphaerisporangium flaviroseum]|uniref:Uncharacterized protein n=2 Tax=Sphaerisporangium flaviroseum TaxID=509199 RepID=A0ABP7JGR3_9ACTN
MRTSETSEVGRVAEPSAAGPQCRRAVASKSGARVVADICWNGNNATATGWTYDTKSDKHSACPSIKYQKYFKHHGWKWQVIGPSSLCANGGGKKARLWFDINPSRRISIAACTRNFWGNRCSAYR